jgi:uncharacterized protein YjbI with pentapeptide repeats
VVGLCGRWHSAAQGKTRGTRTDVRSSAVERRAIWDSPSATRAGAYRVRDGMTTTTPNEPPPYPHCGRTANSSDPVGCRGRRVPRLRSEGQEAESELYEACLAHLNESDRGAYLASLRPGSNLDHRGTTLHATLLADLLDAVREPTDRQPHLGVAHFGQATFKGDAFFGEARFKGNALFDEATFEGDAGFRGATFEGGTRFHRATFKGDAGFREATFKGNALFDEATFEGDAGFRVTTIEGKIRFHRTMFKRDAGFRSATFEGDAWFYGATFEGDAWFYGATFEGDASFGDSTFEDEARFGGATFKGKALFDRATFKRDAGFNRATFKRDAGFNRATFKGDAGFDRATFKRDAAFNRATFKGDAGFDRATFKGETVFGDSTFEGETRFGGATFERDAMFGDSTFEGETRFGGATFEGDALFERATFERASSFGPLVCRGRVTLMAAVFAVAVTLEIVASRVDFRRTRWASTAALRLRYAVVDLSDAVLEFPVSVAAHAPFDASGEHALDESGLVEAPVRVASLRGVNASHLVLSDVDLSSCRFAGTIHLDQLRLHGRCTLATTTAALSRRGLIPVRWTSRQFLAEEQRWRGARGQAGAWWTPEPDVHPPLEPAALAPIYRELRKGFEDAKNEPGAADFYYGEMEMRRHDSHGPAAERVLLWLYWAVSGYGLRASRALGWLLGAMTVTVLLMLGFGLPDTPANPYPPGAGVIGKQDPELHADFPGRFTTARTQRAADVVINSVVFRSSGQHLTSIGRYTEMASRFTEPILLALALLAIRGRVKR